jgi:pimeloyl-ACP methyl ester carboxylesterase
MLSYAQLGSAKTFGPIWVLFHGTPGCRLGWSDVHAYAEARGIKLICIDRPGYGYSMVKNGRSMLDFMMDVEYLLNSLSIKEFKVHGVSGGGPYALAAAYYFPKTRLLKTSIICGMTHPEYEQTTLSLRQRWDRSVWRWLPSLVHSRAPVYSSDLAQALHNAKGNKTTIAQVMARMGEVYRQTTRGFLLDWEALRPVAQHISLDWKYIRPVSRGFITDWKLMARPWDFEIKDIVANPIRW